MRQEVVLWAVQTSGTCLRFACDELRKDPDLCLEAGRKRGTLTGQVSNKMEQGVFKHVQTIQTEAFFQHTDFLSGSETELASHRASRTGCFRFIVQVKIVNNACEDL